MKFSLAAPAKINWFLSVQGKRADGYHNIISPMQFVGLHDELFFEESGDLELITDLDLPVKDNLVFKAAALLRRVSACRTGARITLRKEIPAAAGLGGGSSDAASALMGLNRLWGLGWDSQRLMEIGSEIGSDVPFFMEGPFAVVAGRGEKVSTVRMNSPATLLLVKPDISVSTAWAYGVYEPGLTKKAVDIKLFCQTLDNKDLDLLKNMVFNDLEKGVCKKYHVIEELKDLLLKNGAVIASMSGSGPTVFGVFNSEEEAGRASVSMGNVWCRVVNTLV